METSSRQPDAKSCSVTGTANGADGAADNADFADALEIEGKKLRVIAGPAFMNTAGAGPLQMANDIAVWIEHADFGDCDERQLPLPPGSLSRASGRNTEGALWSLIETIGHAAAAPLGLSSMMHLVGWSQATVSTGKPAAFHSG